MIRVYHLREDAESAGSMHDAHLALREASYEARRMEEDGQALQRFFNDVRTGAVPGVRLLEVAQINSEDLEEALELTTNIDCPWTTRGDARVTAVGHDMFRQRSTSVGDVMVRGETAHMVARVGFTEFAWPIEGESARPEAMRG